MLRQDQLRTLKQTHQTASTVMPLVTAGLAVMSALIAAHERRSTEAVSQVERQANPLDLPRVVRVTTPRTQTLTANPIVNPSANPTVNLAAKPIAQPRERRVSPIVSAIRYLATLLGTLLKVMLGVVAVIVIVAIYEHLEKTNRAVLLTVLVVSVLYLTARVARSRQKRS
jgi:hypothetical protein